MTPKRGSFRARRPDAPQCPADYVEDVRMTEQHRPNAR